jgi:hypothetical protein
MIQWSVPGTNRPTECDIFEIMARSRRGGRTSSSEVIISYHFLSDEQADAIVRDALDERQGELFMRLRAIDPMQFQPSVPWWKFWVKPRTVTWRDYAEFLGFDEDTFWSEKHGYSGIGAKVQDFLSKNQHSSNKAA